MIVNGVASGQIVGPAQQAAIFAGLHLTPSAILDFESSEREARNLASSVIARLSRSRTHPQRDDADFGRAMVSDRRSVVRDPRSAARRSELTPLAENIVDLLCATRRVGGPVAKPCFRSLLDRPLPPGIAGRLYAHAVCLYAEQMRRSDQVKGWLS